MAADVDDEINWQKYCDKKEDGYVGCAKWVSYTNQKW